MLERCSVLATSSPLSPKLQSEVEPFLLSRGVEVNYLLNPYDGYGHDAHLFSAHNSKERLLAIESFLRDPSSTLLLVARGGVGAHELLEGDVLFSLLNDHAQRVASYPSGSIARKYLCGFSDFTVLLAACSGIPGLGLLHGPSLMSFRNEIPVPDRALTLSSLVSFLDGSKSIIPADEVQHFAGRSSAVIAELVGGNLSVVCSLIGTKAAFDFKDRIIILEEVGESPHKIYRNLSHLLYAGVFSAAKGVLLGDFSRCNHAKGLGPTCEEVLSSFFEKLSLPVYKTSSFGHSSINRTIPLYETCCLSDQGLMMA